MPFVRRDFELSPADFHALAPDVSTRELWVPALDERRTLVLGSAQPASTISTERRRALGIEVARRRSGGGAVLVSQSDLVWVDLLIPADDPLWVDDVGRAFEWVGRACAAALADLGVDTTMHTGPPITNSWSDAICFAGVGPGELLADGRKIVGISQRRTRQAARFQVAVLRRWEPHLHADLLDLAPEQRAAASDDLRSMAVGIDAETTLVLAALEESLRGIPSSSPTRGTR